MSDEATKREILELEKRRCEALTLCDIDALSALMAADLVHIHGSGQIDDKSSYLHGVKHKYKFHRVERGDLRIRVYGDFVVVNGPLNQTVSVNGIEKLNQIKAITTQTWVRGPDGWKQNTCHMAFLSMT